MMILNEWECTSSTYLFFGWIPKNCHTAFNMEFKLALKMFVRLFYITFALIFTIIQFQTVQITLFFSFLYLDFVIAI